MYTGYEISKRSRELLHKKYPPQYETFLGHHITEKFGVPDDHPPPDNPGKVFVIAKLEGEGIEGFLVSLGGQIDRPGGGRYHLTWSLDKTKGVKPVDTNKLVYDPKWIEPIEITVTPKTFSKSTEKLVKENAHSFINFLNTVD